MSWDDMVLVGWIARPHGNRGHVVVVPETDFPDTRFAEGVEVTCRRKGGVEALKITASRIHDGRAIVGFAGVESINDAETLRGCELRVSEDALPKLEPGQFWRHDLVGCRVSTTRGEDVGTVIRVDDGGGAPLLVVSPGASGASGGSGASGWSGGSGEVLVPMNDLICKKVDVAARRIEIEPIDGLLSLNSKEKRELNTGKSQNVTKGGKDGR